MKKNKHSIILLLSLFAGLNCISAQENIKTETLALRKFGIGLNFEQNISTSYYYFQPFRNQLLFTYNIKSKIRLEPGIGFEISNYFNHHDNRESKERHFSVGLGLFGLSQKSKICFIYGGKVDYLKDLRINDNSGSTSENIEHAISFGPVIGMDYFISPHFSLGLDFKALYTTSLSKYTRDTNPSVIEESVFKDFKSVAALKFRAFF